LVTQTDVEERSRLFLQAAMHVFSSPLHRIGAEKADAPESRAITSGIATSDTILRRTRPAGESIRLVMPMS
jgi:hypothetical protein